ncbi:C2 domain-containing protein [Heracleum sosnowskyi]|uniref:C2 domain-containing protein n=1 Tax=Heracleum sosnowskyi TaxID=360622 RepID=A0AAD8NET2_9APIA|nr:C2 domain-containing protein [Heracleum sosnowskyi]
MGSRGNWAYTYTTATSSEFNSCLEIMLPGSSVVSKTIEPEMNLASEKPGNLSSGHGLIEGGGSEKSKAVIGVLDVYIHQARDVQNICIYHKQDVYAKICLTDDLEKNASTHTVNGGGRDPVFNENLRLDVRSIESSLKCEIWMLSRIKNYLQDQLLGYALVPLTDVVIENGKLAKEFSLTSDDMFNSPTGSVQLTLAYDGASPEVLEIPSTRSSLPVSAVEQGNEGISSVPREFEMIEFPDPKIANENDMMVMEYYAIPCVNLDSEDPKIIDNADKIIHSEVDTPARPVESDEVNEVSKVQTSQSSASVNGFPSTNSSSPSVSVVTSSTSVCDSPGASKFVVSSEEKTEEVAKVSEVVELDVVSHEEETEDVAKASDFDSHPEKTEDVAKASDFVNQDVVSPSEKTKDVGEAHVSDVIKPLVSVNIEPEQKVVQQDYVDMYMKSMQQFTEALAKMNLPLDKAAPTEKENKESANKEQTSKDSGKTSKVFYGSRAFF